MSKTRYDVVVIGSGAAGGMAAYELCQADISVLMLEAGRDYDPVTESPMFRTPDAAPLHAAPTPDKPMGYYDATVGGGWDVPGEPFSVKAGSEDFQWWRPRMLGGRTNHWGRIALRFGPYDFKPYSRDGLGFDWPITYEEIKPWYDRVERLIGVTGLAQGFENCPDAEAGIWLPPPKPRAHEVMLARALGRMGIGTAAIHAAILTRPIHGRAACLFATPCDRGCSIAANFQSTTVLIPPALGTGNLTVRCNSVATRIETDGSGAATGVTFVDTETGKSQTCSASAVIVAAGAFSSVRLLLNSRSGTHPHGIGNTSGLQGKYIMDSVEYSMDSRIPSLEDLPPRNDDGMSVPHIYVPWWLYEQQRSGQLGFPRGYHIEPFGGQAPPDLSIADLIDQEDSSLGPELLAKIKRSYGSTISLVAEGEMIPNEHTYCELSPDQVDRWGVPTLRFKWQWSEHEHTQVAHMHDTFNRIFSILGGSTDSDAPKMPAGGSAIHEVGGARMGESPETSVTDAFGRCWGAPNVYVLDGATFVSSPDKNPTLTILALASRASSLIAGRLSV